MTAAPKSREENLYYLARIRCGRSVEEISKAIKYDRSYIYKVERNEVLPSSAYSDRFFSFLGIDPQSNVIKINTYVESMVSLLRSTGAAKAEAPLDELNVFEEGNLNTFLSAEELHKAILQLFSKEATATNDLEPGEIVFLWTGSNYDDFTNSYIKLYRLYIPYALRKGVRITHLLRDGSSAEERLEIIKMMTEKIILVDGNSLFKIKVVRDMMPQLYTNDLYISKKSGNIMTLTGSVLGEPSLGIWGSRETNIFDRYSRFIGKNCDERVRYFPQRERKDFYSSFPSTESRTGDWRMLASLPSILTRSIRDFDEGTTWAKRVRKIEETRGGPNLDDLIERNRSRIQLFRERITRFQFRQIISKSSFDAWSENGTEVTATELAKTPQELRDTPDEVKYNIKNIISLMDNSKGNFQIGITDDESLYDLGLSKNSEKNLAWAVQGDESTVVRGVETTSSSTGALNEYHVIFSEPEINRVFSDAFDDAWRSLKNEFTDQSRVREFLISKLGSKD